MAKSPFLSRSQEGADLSNELYGLRMQSLMNAGGKFAEIDPSTMVELASSDLSNNDMMEVFLGASNQVVINDMRDRFELMPSLLQEAEFALLPKRSQALLLASGYEVPQPKKDKGLFDRMATWDFPLIPEEFLPGFMQAALAPVRAVGFVAGKAVSNMWEYGVMQPTRFATHLGRTGFGMLEQYTMPIIGLPVATAGFADPRNWIDEWNATQIDNDSYTEQALIAAEDLIGEERLEMMRLRMRDGVTAVEKRFVEMGEARGESRESIANAFRDWYASLSRPAEQQAMQILDSGRRDLSSSIVAQWNRDPILPDVRPGTAPANILGGVGALTVEILLDPTTWMGTGYMKIWKASRAGIRAGVNQLDHINVWSRISKSIRAVDDPAFAAKTGLPRVVDLAEEVGQLRTAIDQSAAAIPGKFSRGAAKAFAPLTKLAIRHEAQGRAMNKFIDRVTEVFRMVDAEDTIKIAIREEVQKAGAPALSSKAIDDLVSIRMAEQYPDLSRGALEQLLRDVPALRESIEYMLRWHRQQRNTLGVLDTTTGMKIHLIEDNGRRINKVLVDGKFVEISDAVVGEMYAVGGGKFVMRGALPSLTDEMGYWKFLAESASGDKVLTALGGTSPSARYLPKIGRFGQKWIRGKQWMNRVINFGEHTEELTANLARMTAEFMAKQTGRANEAVIAAVKTGKYIDENGTTVVIDLTANISDLQLVGMLNESSKVGLLSRAEMYGLTPPDLVKIEQARASLEIVARRSIIDEGHMDPLFNWYEDSGYRVTKDTELITTESTRVGVPHRTATLLGGARRAVTNSYKNYIHPPGSLNDELLWLEQKFPQLASGIAGVAYYPAKFVKKMTTYVPRAGYIDVLDPDEAIREFSALVEMGSLAHMPQTQINNYIRTFVLGNEAERWLVQTEFFLDFIGRTGALMHAGADVQKFVKKFVRHGAARYGMVADDLVNFHGIGMRRAVLPGVAKGAELSALNVMPNYRELAAIAKYMSFYRRIGWGSWIPHLDKLIARTWRPAVLLRLGYVPRNGGEELFSWWIREGPKGWANYRLARASMDHHIVWDAYGRKVASKVSDEERVAMIWRPFSRLWRSFNELAGSGDYAVTVRTLRGLMNDKTTADQWSFLTDAARQRFFEAAHTAELARTKKNFFHQFNRATFEFAEAQAKRLSSALHHTSQALGIKTRQEIAEDLGRRFDSDFDRRVELIELTLTNPTMMDQYMTNVLGVYDSYVQPTGRELSSTMRQAGFGQSTHAMLTLPMKYMEAAYVSKTNRADAAVAVTQRLDKARDVPGEIAIMTDLAHYASEGQDGVLRPAMDAIIDTDPHYRAPHYVGREATPESVTEPTEGILRETLTAKGTGDIQHEAKVKQARDEGHTITEERVVRPVGVDDAVDSHPMNLQTESGAALDLTRSGEQTASTRLARDWNENGGIPKVGQVIRFVDKSGREVYVRVGAVDKLPLTRKVVMSRRSPHRGAGARADKMALNWYYDEDLDLWFEPLGFGDIHQEVGDVADVAGAAGRGVAEVSTGPKATPDTTTTLFGMSDRQIRYLRENVFSAEELREFAETGGVAGRGIRTVSRPLNTDYELHETLFSAEFATREELTEHLRRITARGRNAVYRVSYTRLDEVEELVAKVYERGTEILETIRVPGREAIPRMSPSEFMYRYLQDQPDARRVLEQAHDRDPARRQVFVKDGSEEVIEIAQDESWESVVSDVLANLPEDVRPIFQELLHPSQIRYEDVVEQVFPLLEATARSVPKAPAPESVSVATGLERIISGGQTGADQAGLFAAEELGIATGGMATKGYRVEGGADPSLLRDRFGLTEHSEKDYRYRTVKNMEESDGTVIFYSGEGDRGTGMTEALAKGEEINGPKGTKMQIPGGRPHIVIMGNSAENRQRLIDFIRDNHIRTLNVAGNRGSKGGADFQANVQRFLVEALGGEKRIEYATERLSKGLLAKEANKDKVYLFGDNLEKRGTGEQAVVRKSSNSHGIPTKKTPDTVQAVEPTATANTAAITSVAELPMNFRFGENGVLEAADGVLSADTFDAIVAGERVATSRRGDSAQQLNELRRGDIVDIYRIRRSGRQRAERATTRIRVIEVRRADSVSPEEWARAEGYRGPEPGTSWDEWEEGSQYKDYTQVVFEHLEETPVSTGELTVGSYFHDSELELNKQAIDAAFDAIPEGKTVVFPERYDRETNPTAGLGTGKADLENKAPQTWEHLKRKVAEFIEPRRATTPEEAAKVVEKETPVYFTKGQGGVLSNFAETPFEFRGVRYRTAEGAYQAWKSGTHQLGFQHLTGEAAKAKASRLQVVDPVSKARVRYRVDTTKTAAAPDGANVELMREILQAKFDQVPEFRDALSEAGRITHRVGSPFWRKKFPELLEELKPPVTEQAAGSVLSGRTLVDLNQATAAELTQLPGIGDATAARIIEYRDEVGYFDGLDALVGVQGISPAKIDKIRDSDLFDAQAALPESVTRSVEVVERHPERKLDPNILAFLLHDNVNPAKFTNDYARLTRQAPVSYTRKMSTPQGQDMVRSTARATVSSDPDSMAIDSPVPEYVTRLFIPMVPLEYRGPLVAAFSETESGVSGGAAFYEDLTRRLTIKFRELGLSSVEAGRAARLLHPASSGRPGVTALNYEMLAQGWEAEKSTHFPLLVASSDEDVVHAIGQVLEDIMTDLGIETASHSRIGLRSLDVNTEALKNNAGITAAERAAKMDNVTITVPRPVSGSTDTASLANPGDIRLSDPFYTVGRGGEIVRSTSLDGGVWNERVIGLDAGLVQARTGGTKPIAMVNDIPTVYENHIFVNKETGEQSVIRARREGDEFVAAEERALALYMDDPDWELVDTQKVGSNDLRSRTEEFATLSTHELRSLLTNEFRGTDIPIEVQHAWIREVRNSRHEVSLGRIHDYGAWDNAPDNLIAMQPVTDEGGGMLQRADKFWQRLLENWFDGVVNPMIGAMVREPMFNHYLLTAMDETKGVRQVYWLTDADTTRMRTRLAHHIDRDDEGQVFIPRLEGFITKAWLGMTPDSDEAVKRFARLLDNRDAKGLAAHLENMLENDFLSLDDENFFRALFHMAVEDDEATTQFFNWAKNRYTRTAAHRDAGLQRAFKLTGAYIDDHRIRSQFQQMVGTAIPFWFAEDNFLRRMGRGLQHNPMMFRNLHLTMNAGVYGGLVQEDQHGSQYLVIPGSEIAVEYMLEIADNFPVINKVFGGGLGAVARPRLATSIHIIPGYDKDRMGQMGFGPILAVPLMFAANRDPSIRTTFDVNLSGGNKFGSGKASDVVLGQIVPAIIARTVTTAGINWPDPRAREKAKVDVVKFLAINGELPSQEEIMASDQPELLIEEFLQKVDMMAQQYQLLQGLSWFTFGTGRLSDLVSHDGWEWNEEFFSLLSIGVPYEEAYPLWMKRVTEETGKPFDPLMHSAFRVSSTTKRTFGVLETTEEATSWLMNNEEFVRGFGLSSSFFMPRGLDSDDDDYSTEAKQRLLNYGLKSHKTTSEFLMELYYKASYPEYHRNRVNYLKNKYALQATGQDTTRIDREWHVWADSWGQHNPVFAARVATGTAKIRREETIHEFKLLLAAPALIPDGEYIDDLLVAMRIIVEVSDVFESLKNQSGVHIQKRRDDVRFQSYQFMKEFTRGRPWLNEMYFSVFLPLIGETWIAKLESGTSGISGLVAA